MIEHFHSFIIDKPALCWALEIHQLVALETIILRPLLRVEVQLGLLEEIPSEVRCPQRPSHGV